MTTYLLQIPDSDVWPVFYIKVALLNELSGLHAEECPGVRVWEFGGTAGNQDVTKAVAADLAYRSVTDGDLADLCEDDAIAAKYFRPFSVAHAFNACEEQMRLWLAEKLEQAA